MENGKDPSVSVSMSLRATTEKILEAVASIKMVSKSAYVEQALWEKFSRDFLTHPKFRDLIVQHVNNLTQDDG